MIIKQAPKPQLFDGCRALAAAIVVQALLDRDTKAYGVDAKRFFRSEWYAELAGHLDIDECDPLRVDVYAEHLPLRWKQMIRQRRAGGVVRTEVDKRDLAAVRAGALSVAQAAERNGCSPKAIRNRL